MHSPMIQEQRCRICGRQSPLIASFLGVCGRCIQSRPSEALALTEEAHRLARREFGLAARPPRSPEGITCPLCVHRCQLGPDEIGYCGLRVARHGRLTHLAGTPRLGLLHWYRDPLPTNCVAMGVCAGQGQTGMHNLAVFYGSCTLDCLYCQNWHYRDLLPRPEEDLADQGTSAAELAEAANQRTFCVCYFGGDPASQMTHALAAGRRLAQQGVVVCWETSGTANTRLMDRAVRLSLQSKGTVKFDLKAYDEGLFQALTGGSNQQTWSNFARAAALLGERPEFPLLIASTLLVPGYVGAGEVARIARFIAELNPMIPYVLLGFAPHFFMSDLPRTSAEHAKEALAAAQAAGLIRVRIGNRHLLSRDY